MKKKLLVKRIFSIVIAIALLISAVPVSLAVQDLFVEETTAKIVREVTELREESVKHFLCEDGSYIAATYLSPVHYQENGEWKEIDNSLSLDRTTLSESGKPTYTTKAGGLSVSIPQNFSDGQKITAQNKGYEISFGINSRQKDVSLKTSASVVELETLSSNTEVAKLNTVKSINNVSTASALDSDDIEAYNAELMTVDNQSSAVTYKEIMPDTDFEYILTSNSIKENIVVFEPKSEYTYSFDMNFGELVPIVKEDNSIRLVERNNTDETIFYIEAPYMYDANGGESTDIEMSLEKENDIYVMTLRANANWINDEERVFPVVIDPTVYMSFNDVFVMDGLLNANTTRTGLELRVGKNLTNIARTYIKPTLPSSIPVGSYIDSAYLVFKEDYFYRGYAEKDIYFQVYDCYDVDYWSPDSITWNNQPYPNSANGHKNGHSPISGMICGMGEETYTFNIKSAVTRWLNGGTNNGLMLASSNENTKIQVDFHSSRALNSENHPQMYINYEVPSVSISNWETDYQAKESSLFTVTTGGNWTAYSDVDWISLSSNSGSGSGTNKIIVTENTSTKTRTGTITVKIGNTIIGNIIVTQFGTEPYLHIAKEILTLDYQESENNLVAVTTNAEWDFEYDNSTNEWLSVNKNASGNGLEIGVTMNAETDPDGTEDVFPEREVYETRSATITVTTDTGNEKDLTVIQLNEPLSYFNTINADGSLSLNNSSEYNHALATWAMELSYAAYNPINNELIPGIPGNFREPPFDNDEWTAKADLESKGFEATMFNYEGDNSVAAHVIGHRTIEIDNIEINNDNLIGEIKNDGKNTLGSVSAVGLYSGTDMGTDSGMAANDLRYSFSSLTSDSGENEATVSDGRQLVVVSVRGSVTILDWLMDLLTQFHVCFYDFDVGAQKVIDSLYGYDNCSECDGSDEKCPCKGYLVNNNITDPIILVTGHSMGAAIANLVAAELNEIEGAGDVYGYTFATPYVKAYPLDAVITQPDNIFNILNTNDVVTYVPTSWLIPGVNIWSRYGIDIPLNMPFNDEVETDILGVEPHSMAVYMNWMENNKDITYEEILEKSSESTVRGLLPKFVQIKCPVGVTIKDSNGNIIAYESQEEGITYPEVTNTGIVSWITDDGEKMFFVPSGVEVASVEIEAYDYGSMDFAVGTAGTTDETEIKVFNDISLYPGKEFLVEVSEEVLPEDTQLFVTENGEIVGEVTETDPHLKSVTVEHVEKDGHIVTYKNFVTDNTVTEIRYIYVDPVNNTTSTSYLTPELSVVKIVEDGDNLIWTRGDCYLVAGDYVYDVVVISGDEMFTYKNAFVIHITEEMAATNQEYYSSVQSQSSSEELLQTYQIDDAEFVSESNTNNYEIPYIVNDNL